MFAEFHTRRVQGAGAEINLVIGGNGPLLLLLHGYPQTHVMWHKVAPDLARRFTVVAPDLRGYGDSAKPPSTADHAPYSKRTMAADMVAVMGRLGFDRFRLVGHDRGARVAYRLALDHGAKVERLALLDILPGHFLYHHFTPVTATAYYHWFLFSQEFDLLERLIGADPDYFIGRMLTGLGSGAGTFTPEALAEYLRCHRLPASIHATMEDYRAGAGIDLAHEAANLATPLDLPLLVLWGARGMLGRHYDVLAVWRQHARDVRGEALDCGHFLAEKRPAETLAALLAFL
jgi:haloacetate dehalogenase